jgi:hypothetical protein
VSANAAVQVTAVNQDPGATPPSTFTGVPVVDNTGSPIGFQWKVGYFPNGTDFTQDAASLISAFVPNGSAVASNPGILGTFSTGVTDAATSIDGSDDFTSGNGGGAYNVFYVIADNANFNAATDYIVLDSQSAWPVEVDGVGATFNLNLLTDSYALLRGSDTTVAADGYGVPFTSFNGGPALTFGIIPEPSSALLLGLGGLGLLIRG